MTAKKRKIYSASPLPKSITRYRNINNSTGYTPAFYTYKTNYQHLNQNNLIIVDDQDGNSSLQWEWD